MPGSRRVAGNRAGARAASVPVTSLGWLPGLTGVVALGLLLVSAADTGARAGATWAEPVFWLGLLVVFTPVVTRLAAPTLSRLEALSLSVLLGLGLYLIKLLQSPLAFTFHDEFLHWRTVDDIINTQHLFTTNYLLPISAFYPGMEMLTAALANITGLTVYGAGVVVIGVGRLVFMLGLFLLYERISGSAQIAAIACALYTANPNFIFFDAAFSYESLALSLLVLVLFTTLAAEQESRVDYLRLTLVGLIAVGTLITTHHMTAYLLSGFLVLWSLIATLRRLGKRVRPPPLIIAMLALVGCVVWTVTIASVSMKYLGPPLADAALALTKLITQEGTPRALFQQASGQVPPLWQRLASIAAVGLILLGLPFGWRQIWRRYRGNSIALALAVATLGYPATLALRFVGAGWEASNRSSEFLFLALALILAMGVYPSLQNLRFGRLTRGAFIGGASVLIVGGLIIGWPPAWLLPGSYQVAVGVAGGSRSIEPEGIAAAEWARDYLGPGNIVGADETNMLLMGTYGQQHVSTTLSKGEDMGWVLFAPALGADQRHVLRQGQVAYLVVDHRLATAPRLIKHYYPGTSIAAALDKFDQVPGVSRVLDSGDIAIYDVRGLLHGP